MSRKLFCVVFALVFSCKLFAADEISLDSAIETSAKYLMERLPAKSRVALLNFRAEKLALSNYVLDNITVLLVNDSSFNIVDRQNLEMIRQELHYQTSGEVSDETAVDIGRKIGAQCIVSGSIETLGSYYRLNIRAVDVQTAKILATRNYMLYADPIISALCGKRGSVSSAKNQVALDAGIKLASDYLTQKINIDEKVVVFNVVAASRLSEYIIDGITEHLVNDANLTVVDRRNLDTLKQELNFQYSGEVSDETAVSIGRRLGAQCIVSGYVEPFGDRYRLLIRAIDVKTAQIKAMRNYVIQRNKLLNTLLGKVTVSDKKMYFALRPGFSIHNYSNNYGDDKNSYSFDIAAQVAYMFNSFIELQTELFFTADTFAYPVQTSMYDTDGNKLYDYNTTYSYSSHSLIIPLMLKTTFSPGILSIGVFGGVYIDAPLGEGGYKDSFNEISLNYKRNILSGYIAGGNMGIKLGPGILLFEGRYMADFIDTNVSLDDTSIYKRSIIALGITYQFGFINRS